MSRAERIQLALSIFGNSREFVEYVYGKLIDCFMFWSDIEIDKSC